MPLVLVVFGASGAWLGSLRVVRPYSTGLTLLAAGLLPYYWKRVLHPAACQPSDSDACHRPGRATRLVFWVAAGLTALMLSGPAWAPLFY